LKQGCVRRPLRRAILKMNQNVLLGLAFQGHQANSWTCFPRPPSKEPPHWPLFILYQLFINRLPATEGTRSSPPETDTWKWGHGLRSESKPMAIATMHPLTLLSLSSCPDARGPTLGHGFCGSQHMRSFPLHICPSDIFWGDNLILGG